MRLLGWLRCLYSLIKADLLCGFDCCCGLSGVIMFGLLRGVAFGMRVSIRLTVIVTFVVGAY